MVGSERRTFRKKIETVRNGPSRSSKIIDFGTNLKRIGNFLLVINSNLGPVLPCCRDIAGLLRTAPKFTGLKPLDYHVWGAVLDLYQKYQPCPTNISELKVALQSIWNDLPQDPRQIHSEFHQAIKSVHQS